MDNCVFALTRWNGGGTPMRQNTEFMYVSSYGSNEGPGQHWRLPKYIKQLESSLETYKSIHVNIFPTVSEISFVLVCSAVCGERLQC